MVIFHKRPVGLSELALTRFLTRACRAVRLSGTVNVLVTTDRAMRTLNRRFRGKDRATDVLSFPAEMTSGTTGDIAISAETASRNADQLGHSCAVEVKLLTLHGVLHLAGHDHESDAGTMAKEERRLRRAFGLPTGLIERNSTEMTSNGRRLPRPILRGRATTPRP